MSWKPLERSTPMRNGVKINIQDEEQWANDQYVVHLRRMKSNHPDQPDGIHLSIRNQDRSAKHDWRHFQRIKNQLAGPDWTGIEIYPPEDSLIDMANQWHLWCFPFKLGIGWEGKRLVGNQAQADMTTPGAVQRDPEKVDLQYGGLSKLRDMMSSADDFYGLPLSPEEGE